MRNKIAIIGFVAFVVIVLGVGFYENRRFPIMTIAGENSIGTWLSGVMLVVCATLASVTGMMKKQQGWYIVATFFLLLAVDEHFMLHEQLKRRIIFSSGTKSVLLYELPVIVGALLGLCMALWLWQRLERIERVLLCSAIIFGSASVVIDVASAGVLWEECCKLTAELSATVALLNSVSRRI